MGVLHGLSHLHPETVDIAPCDAMATWTLASHVTELLLLSFDTKPRVYWIQFV